MNPGNGRQILLWKIWCNHCGFENRAPCQVEPKLIITLKDIWYHENNNKAYPGHNFFSKSFMIFWICKQFLGEGTFMNGEKSYVPFKIVWF